MTMHNDNLDPMGNAVSAPDFGMRLYKIEMRQDGQWVRLGGIFDGPTSEDRISQFSEAFMTAPTGVARSCKTEFRRVECDKNGHIV